MTYKANLQIAFQSALLHVQGQPSTHPVRSSRTAPRNCRSIRHLVPVSRVLPPVEPRSSGHHDVSPTSCRHPSGRKPRASVDRDRTHRRGDRHRYAAGRTRGRDPPPVLATITMPLHLLGGVIPVP